MKVLIIDDSVLFRILLKTLVRSVEGVEVCATASDGEAGLEAVEEHHPDVVLLDVEMPKMTGLDVMKAISSKGIETHVIMCSAFTTAGADVTVKALELGAHDFITKPEGKDKNESTRLLKEQLIPEIEELKKVVAQSGSKPKPVARKKVAVRIPGAKVHADIVGIGISTGGPKALAKVLPELPASFKLPIVIVQHMPKLFITSLANSLNEKCALEVKVAEEGEALEKGKIYIAPGEKQMAIIENDGRRVVKLSDDPPENYCRPAADFLFRSLADSFGARVIGVVMTGMGSDGAKGLLEIKNRGGYTIGQDKETSTIYGMPQEAYKAGAVTSVLALEEIADHIQKSIF